MRKLLLVSLAVLLITGTAWGYQGPDDAGELRGNDVGRYQQDAHRAYRFVRFVYPESLGIGNAATAIKITADSIVVWSTNATSGDDGITVTMTNTTGDTRVAGICIRDVTITTSDYTYSADSDVGENTNWGFIQTYGLSEANVGSGLMAIKEGDVVGTATEYGMIGEFTSDGTDGIAQGVAGFAMNAAAAAANSSGLPVFLKCE